jgi:hypothetical protein
MVWSGMDDHDPLESVITIAWNAHRSLQTKRLAPETGNVQRSVPIAVVNRATVAAHPLPDRKTLSTVWAAERIAPRTGLRCIGLIHLCKSNSCVIAFVVKEVAQHRPAYIYGRLAGARCDLPGG